MHLVIGCGETTRSSILVGQMRREGATMRGLRSGIGLVALAVSVAGMADVARADDPVQICMFRCAPQLGGKGYNQCLDECFSEENSTPAASSSGDFAPIHGSWRGDPAQCGQITENGWEIDASGASAWELTCELLSSSSKSDTFTLHQRCEYYGDVEEETFTFRQVNADEIEFNGQRFERCLP